MDEITNLTNRMRLLETKHRRLNRFTCLLVLALAATLVLGQATVRKPAATQQDEVRAKRFIVVDDDGDCRASFGLIPGMLVHGVSQPGFEGIFLDLHAKSNAAGIRLMVMHDGSPGMRLKDKDGKIRIGAQLSPDGNPSAALLDTDKTVRLKLSLEADGKPNILFNE